jgi:hypothetical protein
MVVSHNMNSLSELCTRGLGVPHGQVAAGPIPEIIDRDRAWTTSLGS